MKALISSKTAWFGAAQVFLAAVGFFTGMMDPQASMSLLITGFTTIGLRVGTSTPIGGIIKA